MKIVEAFGYIWELSENSVIADSGRLDMDGRAKKAIRDYRKSSEREGAATLLLPYYADILSCTDAIKAPGSNEQIDDLLDNLYNSPKQWVDFLAVARRDYGDAAIIELWEASKEVNPQWYPIVELPKEVQEAVNTLENAESVLDGESATHPDTNAIVEAATAVLDANEEEAKKNS